MVDLQSGPVIGLLGQAALLALLAAAVGLSAAGWLVAGVYGVIMTILLARGLSRSAATGLGPANRVTLLRATLVGGVAALITDSFVRPGTVAVLVIIAAVALVLDGVDGWVARRTGSVTELGARFDMEVDAFLLLVLSVAVARQLGPWVLLIGAARYLFVAAGWILPWMRATLPARYWRKPVAAIQGIVLTLAVADFTPRMLLVFLILGAMALLAESFGRDVWWLWRRRGVEL